MLACRTSSSASSGFQFDRPDGARKWCLWRESEMSDGEPCGGVIEGVTSKPVRGRLTFLVLLAWCFGFQRRTQETCAVHRDRLDIVLNTLRWMAPRPRQ